MEYTIKQTTEATGLSADTLRYYEKEGIITLKRHENGYRYFNERDIAMLKNIVVMKYANFTLAEIKSMESIYNRYSREPGEEATECAECNELINQMLNAKITELNQAVSNYQKIVKLMEALLPMIDCVDAFYSNEKQIDEFIEQIFNDIR
jgi:DNA-binding transcriptional MerR regulator